MDVGQLASPPPRTSTRREDALAIFLVWTAWMSLSLFVAPEYGEQSVFDRLYFSICTVAVGAAVGFYLFDRLLADGFGPFALRAAAIMLTAILVNEAIVEPLVFGMAPINGAGVYYALTDVLSITVFFVLIRLAQRLRFLQHDRSPGASGQGANATGECEPIKPDADCFFARVAGGTRRIYAADVIFIQAERDFSRVVCTHGEHFVSESLKNLLTKTSAFGLVRIHKSFAVNLRHVDLLTRSRIRAAGRSLPVGRRHWPDLARRWTTRSGMHSTH